MSISINPNGGHTELNFPFNHNLEIDASCSVVFQNTLYVYGGKDKPVGYQNQRQISKVTGCQLDRIGSLKFDFYHGACTVFQNKTIMLCFDGGNDEGHICRVSESPDGTFKQISKS